MSLTRGPWTQKKNRSTCRARLELLEDRLCMAYTVVDLGEYNWPQAVNEAGIRLV